MTTPTKDEYRPNSTGRFASLAYAIPVCEMHKIRCSLMKGAMMDAPWGTTTAPTVMPAMRSPVSQTVLYRGSQSMLRAYVFRLLSGWNIFVEYAQGKKALEILGDV